MNDDDKPVRNELGHFQKGVSGNPQGGNKPRVYRAAVNQRINIDELFQSELGRVWYELHKVIIGPNTPATARVSAIKEYLDRAVGRSPTSLRVTRGEDNYDTIDVTALSSEVLAALTAAKRSGDDSE